MKRLVSVILSIIMILGVFTACSKGDEQGSINTENVNLTVDSHYESIDASAVRAYEKLCSAVIAGESEAKFNTALIDDVNQLFYTCFPLFTLVDGISIAEDSSGVAITYKNSVEEHLTLVSQFFDKVEEIKAACDCGNVNTDRYIFNVYTYITQNVTIDDSVVASYDTIMQGKGCSAAICSMFEYLVLQGGGKASHVISSSRIISYAEFKGAWYFFNPALDIENNQGKALTGFAMNSSRVNLSQFNFTDNTPVDAVEDNTFDKLKSSVSFEMDGDDVNVACTNDSFVINLG